MSGTVNSVTLTYTVGAAQRVQGVTTSYADSTHASTVAQNMTYAPFGGLTSLTNGCYGTGQNTGCTQRQETYTYNNRLQPVMIQLGYAGALSDNYCAVYNYYSAAPPSSCAVPSSASSGNNGSVMSSYYADNKSSSLSNTQANGYDALSRLTSATAKNLSGSTFWSQTYSYDRYGNGTCSGSGLCTSMSYNTSTNRLTSVGTATPSFDAAGDLTSDPTNSPSRAYAWDAENRMTTVDGGSTLTYVYNALGQRVQVTLPSGAQYEYLFDPSGDELGVCTGGMDTGGRCWNTSWVRAGGRVLGYYDLYESRFSHRNNIGSDTVTTIHDGSVDPDQTLYPWGQYWNSSGTHIDGEIFGGFQNVESWFNPWLNPTNTRKYNSLLYRWLTPDSEQGRAGFSQTENLYAYVSDNPTNLTDPSGLGFCDTHPEAPACQRDPGGVGATAMGGLGFNDALRSGTPVCGMPGPSPIPPMPLPPPPVSVGSGQTGPCTVRSHLPTAIQNIDLCKDHPDFPYFLWAWECKPNGSDSCCTVNWRIASRECEKEGGVSGGHLNNSFFVAPGGGVTIGSYSNCCSKKPKQFPYGGPPLIGAPAKPKR